MWVMDSGLGGLSVVRALRAANPALSFGYLADTAAFPYGNRPASELTARAENLIKMLGNGVPDAATTPAVKPTTIVLACNTLSTLCLADLRICLPHHFVGTVPAIKTAASHSKTHRFTLLATPNTTHSTYTDTLIDEFARDCVVDRVGAPNLARFAEALLLGEPIDPNALRIELAPAFQNDALGKTDSIILGCTHYPLILDALREAAPWNVTWIDSGDAIARRAIAIADGQSAAPSIAYVTAEKDVARYRAVFEREGFADVRALSL